MQNESKQTTLGANRAWIGLFLSLSASIAGLATSGCDEGAGGSGATGGAGGEGGAGGAGGAAPVTCLDASTYADLFTLKDAGFCVVALYDADKIGSSPTWGRHGGPMYVEETMPDGPVALVRMTPPAGSSGKLSASSTSYDVGWPAMQMHFLGGQAVDLPFFNWTAIGYTLADSSGEVLLLDGSTVAKRYAVDGYFSAVGLGDGSSNGRLVYSGLSPLGDTSMTENAIYAAENCGTAANMPRLLPEGDMTCKAPLKVSSHKDDYSGPLAADTQGNVFAVLPNASNQSAFGFAADMIKPGAPAATPVSLFTMSGFSGSLAAVAPEGANTGVLAFQPVDGMTFASLDVVAQRYRVDAGKVVADGTPEVFLALTTKGTSLPFFNDDADRIWVTAKKAQGYAIAVIARAP